MARPATAAASRESSLQQNKQLGYISSNLDQKRGKSIKNIEETNAYQQETPYLNRKIAKNEERKLHLNLPINSKHQKVSIKAQDLIYTENHYQSQQELLLPRM